MTKTLLVAGLCTAVLAGVARADARSWMVCGGNAFNTCASVDLTVSGQDVTIRVWNLSGYFGSYASTVFTAVGFENIGSIAVVPGSMTMNGPVRPGDTPEAWQLRNNTQVGGGVRLDMVARSGNADNSIASGCASPGRLPGGSNDLWMNPCSMPTQTGYVTISFRVTGTWDVANTWLLVKGQNGPAGMSTECMTGGANANCSDVTPEPVTLLLLGSGLAGMGGMGLVRRRRVH